MQNQTMLPIRRVLAPIDWSEPSNRAFQLAASLALAHDAELVVLYVVPVPTVMYGPPPESYLEHMREELSRVKPTNPNTRVQHLMVEGDPATEILRTANEENCDLIAMGTHGRTGLRSLLMGSVAEEVVRKARCLVLTVSTNNPEDLSGQRG
jgi:nucleotide-binding universal stress UspA family protein